MSPTLGALVLFGSGPGIGSHVARKFVDEGFLRVILIARDEKRLLQDAAAVTAANDNVTVDTLAMDLADTANIPAALARLDEKLGPQGIEAVVYNAARLSSSEFFNYSISDLELDMRVSVSGLYAVAQWCIPKMEARGSQARKLAFLVTSGGLYKDPFPPMFSLSAAKAAQYSIVHSIHKMYTDRKIHCGLVVVGGMVSEESKYCSPKQVAEGFWSLYKQESSWDLEIELADPTFAEMMRGN